jgi:hypothetical protein
MAEDFLPIIWQFSVMALTCVAGFFPAGLVVWMVMRRQHGLKLAAGSGLIVVLFVFAISIGGMMALHIGEFGIFYIFAALIAAGLQTAAVMTVSLVLRDYYRKSSV